MVIAIWRNLWRLSVSKRSSSPFTISLRYYKEIVNLLFWVLWTCLAMQTQRDTMNLYKTFMFICRQKTNFTLPPPPNAFLEIMQVCKLLFLGTLGMPGYIHPKWYYQHEENFDIYLHAKKNFIIQFFFEILHFKESCNLIGWQHFGP